jgi:2-dehydro-3-deoxyphosphogluconate aldolase / (4S)-4-hydroxy-2-oxoglutarate aldolase
VVTPFKPLPTPLTAQAVMMDAPVIPVIVLEDVAHAVPMARALVAGGIRMLEITLRTPVALQCMREIAAAVPEAVVGAGTVCNGPQAREAVAAGAKFLVSPGYISEIGHAARELGVPLLPGVQTGSEVLQVLADGLEAAKFFPAVPAGGVNMLKAFSGPFAELGFCPTGGVNQANAKEFLSLPNVRCVGGSWLTPQKLMAAGDWAAIAALAAEAQALR